MMLLLSMKNVIDAVQSESSLCSLTHIGTLWKKGERTGIGHVGI